MPKRKKVFVWVLFCIMLLVAMSDGIRYLRPDGKKEKIESAQSNFPVYGNQRIIFIYNAWGGIMPGTIGFLHKFFRPYTYPCNLCLLSHSAFGMKKQWKNFLDSLPLAKVYLDKDEGRKKYLPDDLPLPVILLSDSLHTTMLVNADEINSVHTLNNLITLVRKKLSASHATNN
ncbi:MAG: hypothetical protein M3015_16390 [Bacteroidota bacterium]|nr:hypothetical protein [Bacteroidota bacterium]